MVAVGPLGTPEQIARKAARAKRKTADLSGEIALAFSFLQVSIDDATDMSIVRQLLPGTPDLNLRRLATVLDGSVTTAVARIRYFYDELGISFFTLHKSAGTSWNTLERIAAALTHRRLGAPGDQ